MTPTANKATLADHLPTCEGPDAPEACSCGSPLPGGFLAHIVDLLGTDDAGARKAILRAHDNVEVNTGMCGGCETCGSEAASAVCAICGEGYSPCAAYFAAILNPDGTHYEFATTEGQP